MSPDDILNARILVVDDQEPNVRLLEGMLAVAGYVSVDSTMDPKAVCELHRKNRYSLILLDLQMPAIDGFQVMEGLKEIEEGGYLPVLVITAQPNHKLRALEAGAKDFVSKPFDLAELRARVHNILEVRLLHLEAKNRGTGRRRRAVPFAQTAVDVERAAQFQHRGDPRRKIAGENRLEPRHLIGIAFAGPRAQVRVPFPEARQQIAAAPVVHGHAAAGGLSARPDRGEAAVFDRDFRVCHRLPAGTVDHGHVADDQLCTHRSAWNMRTRMQHLADQRVRRYGKAEFVS